MKGMGPRWAHPGHTLGRASILAVRAPRRLRPSSFPRSGPIDPLSRVRALCGPNTGATGLVDAPGRRVLGAKGKYPRCAVYLLMFLRQRVCLILGSLRDQLAYPRAAAASDQRLQEVRPDEQKRIPESNRIGGASAGVASPSGGEHHFQPATSLRRGVAFDCGV